ncbi:MAG: branched-chain amino acid ABC transporter ATP-binding protein/permease [Alphaproteobacteria bacterium]|nr:branched-chain amino acid ABC transporter ATP-binding protein/permease [Alphaproteobacteria bacterium]
MAWLGRGLNLPLALAALALAVYALGFANGYQLRLLTVAGIYAILVIGYQFIFGHAGALSLAQGVFFGVGAYVAGVLGANHGWSFVETFPLAILAPTLLAAIVAVPVLRLESHYFALATLGIGQVVLLVAVNWQSVTGGANGIPGVPGITLGNLAVGRGLPTFLFVWAWVALCGFTAWQIMRGLYGRMFELMRTNDFAAQAIGINIGRLRLAALLLSAAMGGLAGTLYVHTLGVISPDALEFPVMVTCLTIAVVGGRYSVAGAIIGAVLLIHLPEWFRFLDKYYLIAYGATMLAVIVGAPYGLAGAAHRLRDKWLPPTPGPMPTAATIGPVRPAATTPAAPALAISNLAKRFGGVHAVDKVSFTATPGEVLGIIGPNGSGKTTLINLITGFYRADAGSLHFRGRDITRALPHAIAAAGIARTFQSCRLVPDMTALDNVAVARHAAIGEGLRSALSDIGGLSHLERARREAAPLLDRLGVADVALQCCGTLPYGTQRRVEIARALATEPAMVMLDEPAAGTNEDEQTDLAARLRGLAADGLALVIVEHNMPFLLPVADRVICLDDGRIIAAGSADEIRRHPAVIAAYLGTTGSGGR